MYIYYIYILYIYIYIYIKASTHPVFGFHSGCPQFGKSRARQQGKSLPTGNPGRNQYRSSSSSSGGGGGGGGGSSSSVSSSVSSSRRRSSRRISYVYLYRDYSKGMILLVQKPRFTNRGCVRLNDACFQLAGPG